MPMAASIPRAQTLVSDTLQIKGTWTPWEMGDSRTEVGNLSDRLVVAERKGELKKF